MTDPIKSLLAENAKAVEECEKRHLASAREFPGRQMEWATRVYHDNAGLCARNKLLCALVEELRGNIRREHDASGWHSPGGWHEAGMCTTGECDQEEAGCLERARNRVGPGNV